MMSDIEKERIEAFIKNMGAEVEKYVVSKLDSKLMIDELKRREALQTDQLTAIGLIISGK